MDGMQPTPLDLAVELAQLGFERVGVLEARDPYPVFAIGAGFLGMTGCVYVWVTAAPDGRLEPLYVGKAGRRLVDRCKQHQGGFRFSVTGKQNLRRIREEYAKGNILLVYARQSPIATILGEEVSLCSVEEEAVIKRLKPTLNGFKGKSPVTDG